MTAEVLARRAYATRLDRSIEATENVVAFSRIREAGRRIHLATVAERPDIALEAAGAIVSLAERRLRQLGGDAA